MKCPECGSDIGPDEKFCGNCGAIVQPSEPSPSQEQEMPFDDEATTVPPVEPDESLAIDETSVSLPPEPDELSVMDETAYMPSVEPVAPLEAETPELTSPPPPPPPPPPISATGKEGKNKTALTIGIVIAVLILLCCCCIIAIAVFLSSEPGQELMNELTLRVLPSLLALA